MNKSELNRNTKVFIAGHRGMVGSAIKEKLEENGYNKIITASKIKLNLIDQKKTFNFLKKEKPDYVVISAAKVGGIIENLNNKEKFIYENLQIQNNLIHGSFLAGVKNLVFLGSSCIYPKFSKQPMKEDYLFSGKLEKTNEAYAIAKLAGIKMCQYYREKYDLNYFSVIPPNLFGQNDNYNKNSSHFFPALLRKIYEAKIKKKRYLKLWGSGKPERELMFTGDFAEALIFFMKKKIKKPYVNIGNGKSYSIKWYAKFIMKKMGINLKIKYELSKPDGMPKKCLDNKLAKSYGLKINSNLDRGFDLTFKDFLKNISSNLD